jgi:hypothetical protein
MSKPALQLTSTDAEQVGKLGLRYPGAFGQSLHDLLRVSTTPHAAAFGCVPCELLELGALKVVD